METEDVVHSNDEMMLERHNKQFSNDSVDIHLDSGYTSAYNSTYGSTNLSGASLTNNESSGRKIFDLEPITEGQESTFPAPPLTTNTISSATSIASLVTFPPLGPLNETPTTRSIRQISAFHITTPPIHQGNINKLSNLNETTPTKKLNYFRGAQTRKSPRTNAAPLSAIPQSKTPQKKAGTTKANELSKHVLFSDKLKAPKSYNSTDSMSFTDDIDVEDLENNENSLDGTPSGNVSIGFSPINKSMSILHESPRRYISTPKRIFKRSCTQTIAKCEYTNRSPVGAMRQNPLRKFKSFSPAVLKENVNWQATLEKHDEQPEQDDHIYNPARKMLKFSSNQFDVLVNACSATNSNSTNTKTATVSKTIGSNATEMVINKSFTSSVYHRSPILKARRRSDLQRQKEEPNSPNDFTKKYTSSSNKNSSIDMRKDAEQSQPIHTDDVHTMDISCNSTPSTPSSKFFGTNEQSPHKIAKTLPTPRHESLANFSIKSNIDMLIHSPILIETPIKLNKRSSATKIEKIEFKTPTKKLRRSISFNPTTATTTATSATTFSSIKDANKENAIYSHLPCTPPKIIGKRRVLKRPLSALNVIEQQENHDQLLHESSDSGCIKIPAAKRKLYDDCSRKWTYHGFEKLDILGHLARENCNSLVDTILSYLTDGELQSAYFVSKQWARCINDYPSANVRRRKLARTQRDSKENARRGSFRFATDEHVQQQIESHMEQLVEQHSKLINRAPFTSCNIKTRTKKIARSPPVSPSKRKFHENQKIVRTLKPGQKLTKCIRCDGNSIVYTVNNAKITTPTKLSPTSGRVQRKQRVSKHDSCPILQSEKRASISTSYNWRSFDEARESNKMNNKNNRYEYAECSRLSCGHKFCMNCHQPYHPGTDCAIKPLGSSPTSDDDYANRISDVRNSRRSLRRLKY